MVIWREPETRDPNNWFVGVIIERLDETLEYEIQYLNSYSKSKDWSKRKFKRAWIDNNDGKEVYTERERPSYDRFGARVSAGQVSYAGFTLNHDGSLPSSLIKQLKDIKFKLDWCEGTEGDARP
jgi:hypothetical protein